MAVPEVKIRRLFVSVDEVEVVPVPGIEGATVTIRAMDWHTKRKWFSDGQDIVIQDGKVQAGEARVRLQTADQELQLILDCVVDWCLPIEKRAKNSDETVVEEMRAPKGKDARETDAKRRRMLDVLCKGRGEGLGVRFGDELMDWLVGECKRVNGLDALSGN